MSNKEELALQAGMQFDEAAELFSEETLETMQMMHVIGGGGSQGNCECTLQGQCACGVNKGQAECECTPQEQCSCIATPTPTPTPCPCNC